MLLANDRLLEVRLFFAYNATLCITDKLLLFCYQVIILAFTFFPTFACCIAKASLWQKCQASFGKDLMLLFFNAMKNQW